MTNHDLTIGVVSHTLDVPVSQLWVWMWRHQQTLGRNGRDGDRHYSQADLATLTQLRDVAVAKRASPAEPGSPLSLAQAVDQVLVATYELRTSDVIEALQQSRRLHGLSLTLEQVVLPALRMTGQPWNGGRGEAVYKHLLAAAIQAWMTEQHRQTKPPRHQGTVVLACGPEDQHTLALEAFALLLADRGLECRYLGAQTPVSSLVLAAQHPPARAAVVVSYLDQARPAAAIALHAVAALPVTSFYAGAAFIDPEHRRGLPGTYLGETLSGAARQVTNAFTT